MYLILTLFFQPHLQPSSSRGDDANGGGRGDDGDGDGAGDVDVEGDGAGAGAGDVDGNGDIFGGGGFGDGVGDNFGGGVGGNVNGGDSAVIDVPTASTAQKNLPGSMWISVMSLKTSLFVLLWKLMSPVPQ